MQFLLLSIFASSMQESSAVGSAQDESANVLPETADGAQPENNAEEVIVKTGKIQLKYDAEHQDALTLYVNGEKFATQTGNKVFRFRVD